MFTRSTPWGYGHEGLGLQRYIDEKYHKLEVKHSFYVPDMPVTLISTKALFRYHGIRTYFNDELYMLYPDGRR